MKKQLVLESTQPATILKRFKIVKSLLEGENTVEGISYESKVSKSTVYSFLKIIENIKKIDVNHIARESEPAMPHIGGVSVGYNEYYLSNEAKLYFSTQIDLWEKLPSHDIEFIKELRTLLSPQKNRLFEACKNNDIDTVKELISQGYSIDIKDGYGFTGLFYATRFRFYNIVELLVRNNADINFIYNGDSNSNFYNESPIDFAIKTNDKKLIDILLKHCKNFKRAFRYAIINEDEELFNTICSYSPKLDPQQLGELLLIATQHKKSNFANKLIELGADVNFHDEKNITPLYYALLAGKKELVNLLLKRNATVIFDINNAGKLLSAVIESKDVELLKIAIDLGMNVNKYMSLGETTLYWVLNNRYDLEYIKKLIEFGADINPAKGYAPILAIRDTETFFYFIEKGADIRVSNTDGTLLHRAAKNGNYKIAEYLIKHKLNVNQKSTWGKTPLYWAVYEGHFEIVKLLIDNRAKIDFREYNGDTLLHIAAEKRDSRIAEILIKKNINVNQQGHLGYTPLHLAVQMNRFEIVKLLVENGAKIDVRGTAKGYNRVTPISLAIEKRNQEIQLYLETKMKEQITKK